MTPRERDALVAEKVMGWTLGTGDGNGYGYNFEFGVFRDSKPWSPSTDIAAAWEVVEKLFPAEDEFNLRCFRRQNWKCTFRYFEGYSSYATTAPEAICLAALTGLGVEIG